jgi:hypothetical protein
LQLTDKPAQNLDTAARRIDDAVFIIHPENSEMHQLREVGARIWELTDGEHTVAEIAAVICAEYDVQQGVAESDALEFLSELLEKDLISL